MFEAFLHFIWKYQLYSTTLVTEAGEPISVISPGIHNRDSGPDFTDARILIGNTLWAGNVEIHVKASDWNLHGHSTDKAYSNVILHVVYEDNIPIYDSNGRQLDALVMKGKFSEKIYHKYYYFLNNSNWIPCEKDIHYVPPEKIRLWLESLLISRMERKANELKALLEPNLNDFEETFYQALAANFGFKVNQQPFAMLARMLPLQILEKHVGSQFQIEAMLFGVAGLLSNDFNDNYPNRLKKEFEFLQKKYGLVSMQAHLWKFMRLRPPNFPTIRISQFAALINKSSRLFSAIIETDDPKSLISLCDVRAANYWNDHFTFDKPSPGQKKNLGTEAIDNILINTVTQMLFLYSISTGAEQYRDKALALLSAIGPESNSIIKKWNILGIESTNAFDSQALIELKNRYCKLKRCLDCSIGLDLLKMNSKG